MAEILDIFTNNIFSIAVAIYLLVYINSELKNLNENIVKLAEKIDHLCK